MSYNRTRQAGRSGATGSSKELLPWLALAASVCALAAGITMALASGGRIDGLKAEGKALADRVAALESVNGDLAAGQKSLSARLAAAEERCRVLAARVPGDERLKTLAAEAARRELARRRAPAPAGALTAPDPARAREVAEKKAAEIAAIREKVEKKEMTPEEGRKEVAAKVQEGLKQVLPAEAVERMEKARAEREKNMTEEEKKRAEGTRAAVLDGIGDWMAIQEKVRKGEMTREQAREELRKKWRERMKNLPEDQRKMWEERMRRRRPGGGGREPEPAEEF